MNPPPVKNTLDYRRQIIFLRTFDQKIEGLRRENERLERIISNPKIHFSRSSLGGLYRIVNSLLSAGPMYGLSDIEAWAKQTREWTVALGKRRDKPTKEELGWLLEAIAELGELKDKAMAEIREAEAEAASQPPPEEPSSVDSAEPADGDAAEPSPDDEGVNAQKPPFAAPVSTAGADPAPEAAGESGPDSPFDLPGPADPEAADAKGPFAIPDSAPFEEEPRKQSVREVDLHKPETAPDAPSKRRGRERTNTIPLMLEDLNEVGPATPPPLLPSERRNGVSPAWRTTAIAAIVACLLMVGYHLSVVTGSKTAEHTPSEPPAAAANSTPDPGSTPSPTPAESPAVQPDQAASPSDDTPAASDKSASGTAGEDGPSAAAAEKAASESAEVAESSPKEKNKAQREGKRKRAERRRERQEAERTEGKQKKDEAAGNRGTLVVKAPAEDVKVFILVDGISRGKAPVRVKLDPGIHEVVFNANGRRAMRMVPIREGKTKTIDAKIP